MNQNLSQMTNRQQITFKQKQIMNNLLNDDNNWSSAVVPLFAAEGCSSPQELEKNRLKGSNFSSINKMQHLFFFCIVSSLYKATVKFGGYQIKLINV